MASCNPTGDTSRRWRHELTHHGIASALADADVVGAGCAPQAIPAALAALRANTGRSILTTLGIIIGVAAVIAIVALGQGASASVSSQLAGLGTNLLTIMPGSASSGGARTGAGTARR